MCGTEPFSLHQKVWFLTLNLPSSGSQVLKSKTFRITWPVENNATLPFTKVSKDQVGLKVHIDDNQNAFTSLYSDDMVTPLVGDLVCDNCMIWQDVRTDENGRSANVHVVSNESTKHPKLSV